MQAHAIRRRKGRTYVAGINWDTGAPKTTTNADLAYNETKWVPDHG